MLSISLQIVEFVSFIALTVLIWRVSKRPRWRIRAVIYGWGLYFLWALFWAALMPMWFRGKMDSNTLVATFPDGTTAMVFLVFGWCFSGVVAAISSNRERKKRGNKDIT
jgi:hypothetical protein